MSDSGILPGHCREHGRDREWCVDCLRAEVSRLRDAIGKVNGIRNSIIGLQTINWSEHVYPLVAALKEAGMEGMDYPEAQKMYGSMLERTCKAEVENTRLREALEPFAEQADIIDAKRQDGDRWDDASWFRFGASITAITLGCCRRAKAALLHR